MQASSLNKRQSKRTFYLSQICGNPQAEMQKPHPRTQTEETEAGEAPRILSPNFECKASRERGEEVELLTSLVEYVKLPVRDHFLAEKETDPVIQHFSAWGCFIQGWWKSCRQWLQGKLFCVYSSPFFCACGQPPWALCSPSSPPREGLAYCILGTPHAFSHLSSHQSVSREIRFSLRLPISRCSTCLSRSEARVVLVKLKHKK